MPRIKNYFFRGLAVLLPTILTLWIFWWGYNFIKDNISKPINEGLVTLSLKIQNLDKPAEPLRSDFETEAEYDLAYTEYEDALKIYGQIYTEEKAEWKEFWVEGWGSVAGFVISLAIVIIVGFMLASVVGKWLWRMIEKFILNTPLIRRVYPYVKQVTDFLLTQDEQKKYFSRVVAVEYPRKGIWSIGFVTGSGLQKISQKQKKKEFVTVLIPNSPTPLTGYVIIVPKEDTIIMDMTIEEAFRFAISAGVITPMNEDEFLENKMLSITEGKEEEKKEESEPSNNE